MGIDRIVYIRTEGNETLATGHLVRCLSIAERCLQKGLGVCFFLPDKESKQLLSGFLTKEMAENPKLCLHLLQSASPERMDQELSEVISLLLDAPDAKQEKPLYLVDSYSVTRQYFRVLKDFARVIYLDDLQSLPYHTELVINYDVIPRREMCKYRWAYRKAKNTLLGASYAPLRSQFANQAISIKEKPKHILVTTGGSDPYHFCLEFLQLPAIADYDCIWHIVIGKLNKDRDALHTLAENHPRIQLHENVTDMSLLMKQCDLAVSAAGTTLYELCALGVPTISFTMADNQLTAARAFAKTGAIPLSGDIRLEKTSVFSAIFEFISRMGPADQRKKAHQTMRNLVDGNGADRIAEEILRRCHLK